MVRRASACNLCNTVLLCTLSRQDSVQETEAQRQKAKQVHKALLGDRNINKQHQHDKSKTSSKSAQETERRAVATHYLHFARFL